MKKLQSKAEKKSAEKVAPKPAKKESKAEGSQENRNNQSGLARESPAQDAIQDVSGEWLLEKPQPGQP